MEQMSFFDTGRNVTPLADRLRPEEFSAFAGQEHLIGEGKLLRRLIENNFYDILGTSGSRKNYFGRYNCS